MSIRNSVRALALGVFACSSLNWSCSSDSTGFVKTAPSGGGAPSIGGASAMSGGAGPTAGAGASLGGSNAGANASAGAANVAGSAGLGGSFTGGSSGAAGSAGLGLAGAPSAGAGGSGGAPGGAGSTSTATGFGGAPTDKPDTVEVGVRNNCPFPIWIHGEGNGGVLGPDDQQLKTAAIAWYDAPKVWSAARVTAYSDGPRMNELDKVEMTLVNDPAAGEVLNYNVTYVDWLGLPVEIVSKGGGPDCKPVGCYVKQTDVLNGCPSGLLSGKKCLSPRSYCLDPTNSATALCNSLNAEITKCVQTKDGCAHAAGATTAEVFACSGKFSEDPKWCSALNRHMLDNPDDTDKSKYYATDPYNTYSKWVHQVCPGIYAFAYDDYPAASGESGFHACAQGKELEITFCPAG